MDSWFESLDKTYEAWTKAIYKAGLEGKYRELELNYYIWQPQSGISWHNDKGPNRLFGASLYLNDEWHRDWGGETIFYDLNDEITKAVLPKPGRVVSFDGRIPHSARPPLTAAHRPRYITVMKF